MIKESSNIIKSKLLAFSNTTKYLISGVRVSELKVKTPPTHSIDDGCYGTVTLISTSMILLARNL